MNVSVVARKGLDEETLALVQRLVAMIPWPFDRQAKADVAATLLDGRLRLAEKVFDSQSQADSRLGTTLRYLNASAASVRETLVSKGYAEAELPSVRTISNLLNRMGYRLRTVIKAKPQKKRQKQT